MAMLSAELLGRVLQPMAPENVRAARLVSRTFDEASRLHTNRASEIKLDSENVGGDQPGPDWARFPRLRRLALATGWEDAAATLRRMFALDATAAAAAALAGVEEVEVVDYQSELSAATWAAVLWHSPAVKRIELEAYPSPAEQLALFAALTCLAQRLEAFCVHECRIDARSAAAIARLPALRDLQLLGDEMIAAHWHALPCSRLTRLRLECFNMTRELAEGAAWPMLRVLGGVSLSVEEAKLLARRLPNLERLEASVAGDGWGSLPARGAAFESVTWARVYACGSDFCSSPHVLARLVPNVERVELLSLDSEEPLRVACDFGALTRLVNFSSGWMHGFCSHIVAVLQPAAWESLARVTGLKSAALALELQQLPRLSGLPPSIETLTLRVTPSVDWIETRRGTCELGAVLEAALRAPGLRALRLELPAGELRHSRALARAAASAARLRVLGVDGPQLALHDICALAMMPGLSRLSVFPTRKLIRGGSRLWSLVAQYAAEGLQITCDTRPAKSVVMPPDELW